MSCEFSVGRNKWIIHCAIVFGPEIVRTLIAIACKSETPIRKIVLFCVVLVAAFGIYHSFVCTSLSSRQVTALPTRTMTLPKQQKQNSLQTLRINKYFDENVAKSWLIKMQLQRPRQNETIGKNLVFKMGRENYARQTNFVLIISCC